MRVDKEILCQTALTKDGWLSPARITLDDKGYIDSVSPLDDHEQTGVLRGAILPGMPNLHSHAFQRQMAGLTEVSGLDSDNFWTWREVMYKLANQISPKQLQAIASWLQAEMLEAGFTSCGEFHYIHHQAGGQPYENRAEMCERLLRSANQTGISMTLLPVLYCRSGFNSTTVNANQSRFRHDPEQFNRLLSECNSMLSNQSLHLLGVAPHSLRAVSRKQLDEVLAAWNREEFPIHIHIAEQTGEVEACLQSTGARPLEYLLDHFSVDENWCLVHATHLEKRELERATESGAVAGLCPITEANLGDGFFQAEHWLHSGGQFGIGTDSNVQVSVQGELRMLEYGCRLRSRQRNVLAQSNESCGRSVFDQAISGGAAALGHKTGRIEAGFRADLLELDIDHAVLQGRSGDQLIDSWIFAGDDNMVKSVWVAGQQWVEQGRHIRKHELEIPFRTAMRELL